MTFTLDDAKRSELNRKVEIKHITQDSIGAAFVNPPEYDKDLGFYLMQVAGKELIALGWRAVQLRQVSVRTEMCRAA